MLSKTRSPFPAFVVAQLIAIATADDNLPRKGTPLAIGILMMDEARLGAFHLEQVKAATPGAMPLPSFYRVHYMWDGVHLRVRPAADEKREWSEKLAKHEGWYVAADYSTKPPSVILAKEPGIGSRWQFVPTSRKSHYYIRNEVDGRMDTWLNFQDRRLQYSFIDKTLSDSQGVRQNRYWDAKVYDIILSTETRDFFVRDIKEDGGK
jgi:hypothetical protein